MNKALLSSARDDWETPPEFFSALNEEFRFTLDVCALPETAKCPRYYTPEDDGLSRPWIAPGGRCILQSAVLEADKGQARSRGLDQKGRRGGQTPGSRGRYAHSRPDGHDRFSRVHIPQGGNPLYQGPPPFPRRWTGGRRGPIPEYGRYFQRPRA